MFLDNQPASQEQLDLFRLVKVDQAIGMVCEAELEIELRLDDTGHWVDFDEAFTEPFSRIRVEVRVGDGSFTPLIDGPVIGQRATLSAAANESRLTLLVHDDSVRLNQHEAVALFEEMSVAEIARQLFAEAGLGAEVDSVDAAGGTLDRAVVQRGTPMQLLRELARRHGMFVYVRPGPDPDSSIGVFQRPALGDAGLPALILLGAERNLDRVEMELDGLRPFTAAAAQVDLADQSVLRAEAAASSQETLGDDPTHDLVEPASLLLARTRETGNDLDAAAAAAVDHSTWAYSANGEVDSAGYPGVLQPHVTVDLAGAGPMSGRWLIGRVTHSIDDNGYRQRFRLRRNARSAVGGDGGLLGGVF